MSAMKMFSGTRHWLGASGLVLAIVLAGPAAYASTDSEATPQESGGVAEILVTGQRSLNNDIPRDRDDIQPYVVFDSELLKQSGAQNIEDFLQARLPMNATQVTQSQAGPPTSAAGRLDLRGLGADETLVLVDGRRLPSIAGGDTFGQPNINGISIAQIERIEVLPSTASGIYGGGATGGVINIILKRNYSGLDLEARYNDSTDFKAGQSFLSINGGLTFDEGRMRVMGSFSRSRAETLVASDRNFFRRGAELQFRNDPANQSVLLGGPNICSTLDGFDCSNDPLILKSGTALGSSVTSIPDNYSGNLSDLAARSGKLVYDRSNVPIWTAPDVTNYNFNVRREFGKSVEVFADFSRDESKSTNLTPISLPLYVPADAPSNPFQQDVLRFIDIPDGFAQTQNTRNKRVNVGAIIRLPGQWSAALEYDWLQSKSRSVSNTVLGPSFDGEAILQAAAFTDLRAHPLTNPLSLFDVFESVGASGATLETASLRLGGPLVKLPGGNLTATALLEKRWESSDETVNASSFFGLTNYFWSPKAVRNVESGYLELRAPIIGEANDVPFIHALEIMGSVRHDRYETRYSGSSIPVDSETGPFPEQAASINKLSATNYTFGFKYEPIKDITFRASWGNGFLPPRLGDIRSEPPAIFSNFLIFLLNLRDPARENALIPGPLSITGGGNPNLKPERSNSFSAGVILTPRFVPGLRLSVDLTSIRKSDEVLNLPVTFYLANAAAFPGRITRGPNLPGDAPGTPGPITAIDTTALNLSKSKLRAVDIQADYNLDNTGIGSLHFYGVATHTSELSLTTLAGKPSVNRAGFFEGPLKWRGNVGVDWKSGSWSAGWNTQIYGSYRICESFLTDFTCNQKETWQGSGKVRGQTYSDIYVNYDFKTGGILGGSSIRVGIQNLFDQKPPTIASGVDQLGYSSFGDPRLQRFTLSLRKHF
ncbi:TonB-dependent receptor domain-containing protein [Novosphingobium taihuense]|uniref:Outer membrane receptor protein involved in Fe transport n=1 Tax=Novosphingobium taihuense TaxID=260085 RepID=A0A7W7ESL6_9SPHN|nr:TonB-dependent receptor [Novosphingobium taihuense]MBB4611926.1 outer membrane receptor protein involved in Fe transport [Novosphingobium taihuense]TWH88721.1 TonB-dependent receptor-like protein [Novosphingobium taihuense]